MPTSFDAQLQKEEISMLAKLDNPTKIQAFLDSIPYSAEDKNRCPLSVLHDRVAHCLDGALFGASLLRRLGYPPLVLDMFPDPGMDDDHVLAIFKRNGCYGSIAKSNFAGLRYREPVYRNLRELVMSYFDDFFNVDGIRTLRNYTLPINLSSFDKPGWEWSEEGVDMIENRLLSRRRIPLITPEMATELTQMDERSFQAGMLGTIYEGLYKPTR